MCGIVDETRIVRLTPSLCLLGGYAGLMLLLLVSVIVQSSRFGHLMLVQQMSEKVGQFFQRQFALSILVADVRSQGERSATGAALLSVRRVSPRLVSCDESRAG